MSLLIHTKVLSSSDRYQRKNMQRMKLSFVVFICCICDAFSISLHTVLSRVRRWENGDMGTGDLSNMFRGTAGVDYPDLKTIPNTNFRCEDQIIYEGGLYADVETRCQLLDFCINLDDMEIIISNKGKEKLLLAKYAYLVHTTGKQSIRWRCTKQKLEKVYHVCHDGRKDSFMCGKGTIFNQQILACDYWYSADCESAPNYYHLNSQIGDSASLNNLDNNSQQGVHHHNTGNIGGRQSVPNRGGNDPQHSGPNQQPCCCNKSSNQRPWSFPAGMIHGDK